MGWDVIRKEDAAFYESSANIALRLADAGPRIWGRWSQGFLLQAVVCLIALAPLLFLSVPQAAPLAPAVPGIVCIAGAAHAAKRRPGPGLVSLLDRAEYPLGQVVSFQDYGRKLLCSLRQGLWLVVWGWPCLAVTVAHVHGL